MKIALVHDQLSEFGGAERVFIALSRIFPLADIFTSFINKQTLEDNFPEYKNRTINVSWFGKLPKFFHQLYSPLRFLAPQIWESFDFSDYDLVISSSGWYMCKGIITKKPTVHICYLHHQPRYLWGYETALEWQKYWPVRIYAYIVNKRLRVWDYRSSQRPDYFIVNSEETKKRAKKFYHRTSTVIYPPVNIPKEISNFKFQISNSYYITVSRLTKAKHIDLLIQAANIMKFQLKIVGGGKDEAYLRSIAGPTVDFVGKVPDDKLSELNKNAKAFLFSSVDEEFGIAPVEAMGWGTPVIAYASGGLKETVHDGTNGYLFDKLHVESLITKIKKLESLSKTAYFKMRESARQQAENYSEQKFKERMLRFIKKA